MALENLTPKQRTAIKAFIVALIGLVGAFAEKYSGIATMIGSWIGGLF